MAFLSKVGNILRQTASRRINSELSASNPSIFQAIRCMSSSKLFIGGISYSTDDQSLREAFAQYGDVVDARIIMDRETGRSRGFGFVTYTSSEEASSAIQALDGSDLHGRRVRVNYAADRPRPSFGGGGGYGGGGGGYGGGGYGGGDAGGYNSGGYGSGGGGGNYGGSGSGDLGSTGNYGGSNFGVSGGVGGSNNFASDSGLGGSTVTGFGAEDGQFGGDAAGSLSNSSGNVDQVGQLEGDFRDEDDNEPDDFAKRA